jgi:hypothetical protein
LNQANLSEMSHHPDFLSQGPKSRKSRMKTAISRNQDYVRSSMVENSLLKIVLSKLKHYKVLSQLLNGVRFECYRFD